MKREVLLDHQRLYHRAVRRLSRREYAVQELRRVLVTLADVAVVDGVMRQLEREGLLSDRRYAEQRALTADRRGWGPIRLERDLQAAGINPDTIAEVTDEAQRHWVRQAVAVRRRRFGDVLPRKTEDTARQIRFLRNRGFTPEQIHQTLKRTRDDDFGVGVEHEQ